MLESCIPQGVTKIEEVMKNFVHQHKRRGLVVVITDLYDHQGYQAGMNYLRYHRFEPFLIHIYDKDEFYPEIKGDLQLVDCETGLTKEITVTKRLLNKYRQALDTFLNEAEEFSIKSQISYFRAPIQLPFDQLILKIFRAGGFLK
jgi:hypothetical protein